MITIGLKLISLKCSQVKIKCYKTPLTQYIKKAALARIGGPSNDHLHSTAETLPPPLITQMLLYFHLQLGYSYVHCMDKKQGTGSEKNSQRQHMPAKNLNCG